MTKTNIINKWKRRQMTTATEILKQECPSIISVAVDGSQLDDRRDPHH